MFGRRSNPHRRTGNAEPGSPGVSPCRSPRSVFALVPHRTPRGHHSKESPLPHFLRDGKPREENLAPPSVLYPPDLTESSEGWQNTGSASLPQGIFRTKSYETEAASTQPTSTSHDGEPLTSSFLPNHQSSSAEALGISAAAELALPLLQPPPPPESVSLLRTSSQSVCSELSEEVVDVEGRPPLVAAAAEGGEGAAILQERESSEAGDNNDDDEEENSGRSVPLNPPALLPFVPPEYVVITRDNCFPLEL